MILSSSRQPSVISRWQFQVNPEASHNDDQNNARPDLFKRNAYATDDPETDFFDCVDNAPVPKKK